MWLTSSATPPAPSASSAISSDATPIPTSSSLPARAPEADSAIRRSRPHRGTAQTEPLRLRDQRDPQRSGPTPQPYRRPRGTQGGGFAPLPRRLDEERPTSLGRPSSRSPTSPTSPWNPAQFTTTCGGLFLFLPDLLRLGWTTRPSGSSPRLEDDSCRPTPCALAWRSSSGPWNAKVTSWLSSPTTAWRSSAASTSFPRKATSPNTPTASTALKPLNCWRLGTPRSLAKSLFEGSSFNLDFHSVPYYGEDPVVERHYVSASEPPPTQHPCLLGPRR